MIYKEKNPLYNDLSLKYFTDKIIIIRDFVDLNNQETSTYLTLGFCNNING